MPNDRDKLLTIINNLELDYRAGNISKDKYDYLINEYNRRLRLVENNGGFSGGNNSISTGNLDDSLQGSQLEDTELINKFIVRKNKPKKEKKSISRGVIITFATIALLLAFIGGIGFGVFNFDFNADSLSMFGQASISDTAFPVVVPNITVNVTNYTSSHTDYNASSYSNYSDTDYNDYNDGGDDDSGEDHNQGHDSSSSGGNSRQSSTDSKYSTRSSGSQ